MTGDHEEPIDRLRGICMALPEATERLSHGEPAFFVRDKKTFITYADHHHDDRLAFRCAAPEGFQRMLVEAGPGRFFVPSYVGHRGWLGDPYTPAFWAGATCSLSTQPLTDATAAARALQTDALNASRSNVTGVPAAWLVMPRPVSFERAALASAGHASTRSSCSS